MNQFPLKGRWVALAFGVMTLFVAYLVVGNRTDESAAVPPEVTGEAPPQVAQNTTVEPTQAPEEMDDSEFVDDDSLIDQASGDDPTPPDDGGDNAGGDDFGDAGNDGGDSVVTTEPPQFTPDGTPITPGTS
ncbi:MAG: hypothetical protein J7496_12495 [Novosphingobium sp.]|nr:hypothetical protein [Novosphingobium sp.]MBO9603315.1 hypothetical protein [Novosphingobium sp.]